MTHICDHAATTRRTEAFEAPISAIRASDISAATFAVRDGGGYQAGYRGQAIGSASMNTADVISETGKVLVVGARAIV